MATQTPKDGGRRPNAGAFKPGHHPVHDMAAAGYRGKCKSPWRRGYAPEKAPAQRPEKGKV